MTKSRKHIVKNVFSYQENKLKMVIRSSTELEHLFRCSCENLMLYLGFICLFTHILMLEILFSVGWVEFSVICPGLVNRKSSRALIFCLLENQQSELILTFGKAVL